MAPHRTTPKSQSVHVRPFEMKWKDSVYVLHLRFTGIYYEIP